MKLITITIIMCIFHCNFMKAIRKKTIKGNDNSFDELINNNYKNFDITKNVEYELKIDNFFKDYKKYNCKNYQNCKNILERLSNKDNINTLLNLLLKYFGIKNECNIENLKDNILNGIDKLNKQIIFSFFLYNLSYISKWVTIINNFNEKFELILNTNDYDKKVINDSIYPINQEQEKKKLIKKRNIILNTFSIVFDKINTFKYKKLNDNITSYYILNEESSFLEVDFNPIDKIIVTSYPLIMKCNGFNPTNSKKNKSNTLNTYNDITISTDNFKNYLKIDLNSSNNKCLGYTSKNVTILKPYSFFKITKKELNIVKDLKIASIEIECLENIENFDFVKDNEKYVSIIQDISEPL